MSFSSTQNMVAVAVGVASASVQIAATDSVATATRCQISNCSTSNTAVVFGISGVTAAFPTGGTAGGSHCDAVLPPNAVLTVDVPKGTTYVACIGSAANGTCYFSFGNGA
jgi:hypothetical protein